MHAGAIGGVFQSGREDTEERAELGREGAG